MTNYLGVDIGRKRIGLSIGSDDLMMALPSSAVICNSRSESLSELSRIVYDLKIDVVVFGYPFNMDGSVGTMAEYVDLFISDFRLHIPTNIILVKFDERLTSAQAESDIRIKMGKNFESAKHKRDNRRKGVIDSNAAAIILQDYLNELMLNQK